MSKFLVVDNQLITPSITLLTLRQEPGAAPFKYRPGQYAAITFRRGGRPVPTRCFSITSSPSGHGTLQFGVRIKGNFTNAVAELRRGDDVRVSGPYGKFTLAATHHKPVVMLAGGIGITPIISMIRYATYASSKTDITLIYSCSNLAELAFARELSALEQENPHLRVIITVSQPPAAGTPRPPLKFTTGRITANLLDRALASYDATFMLCGPSGFMSSLASVLTAKGVPAHNIITESFTQADQLNPTSSWFSFRSMPAAYALATAGFMLATGLIAAGDLGRTAAKVSLADSAAAAPTPYPAPTPFATPAPSTAPTADPTVSSTPAPTPAPVVATPVATPVPVTYSQPPRSSVS